MVHTRSLIFPWSRTVPYKIVALEPNIVIQNIDFCLTSMYEIYLMRNIDVLIVIEFHLKRWNTGHYNGAVV